MLKLIWIVSLLCSMALANFEHAPQNFNQDGKTFVFVDMQSADYDITYDISEKQTSAVSKIVFHTTAEGYPLFDLIPNAQKIFLGKQQVQVLEVSLPDGGKMKALNLQLAPGTYTFEVHSQIEENVSYSTWFSKEVRAAFWMSDLSDRRYLEQYLPTNLEFDQIPMHLTVSIQGADKEHIVKSNGVIEKKGFNQFSISYPDFYATSSIFFHIYPKGAFEEKAFMVESIDGRQISFQLYSKSSSTLNTIAQQAPKIFRELEKDYGPWPHPHLIVYGAGSGGMEYVGATITSVYALGHEMHHSYFARGIIPARGNDGWIDEALASWRDESYRQSSLGDLSITRMSGHSPYRRTTDRAAYSDGERIIGHLDQRFQSKGGMIAFLKDFASKNMYQINTTQFFQKSLEDYFSTDLKSFFDRYIYGKKGVVSKHSHEEREDNPYHPHLSKKQLFDLL